jgi:hypothetical protein
MKDDRLRVPVDTAYLTAIGMATYCFARMEWDAVYCGEKLNPGYVNTVASKTAGRIGSDITDFAQLEHFQADCAARNCSNSLFDRMIHAL